MNLNDPKYNRFALVREMLETPRIVGEFDFQTASEAAQAIHETGRLFLTGEGSSRIFPAKNLICEVMKMGIPLAVTTEGGRQAHEYDLSEFAVFGASNSGKTKELISLFTLLCSQGHKKRFGLTANTPCPLEGVSTRCHTLRCGKEDAVAATKSVVEQALFYRSLLAPWEKQPLMPANQAQARHAAQEVLETDLEPGIVQKIAHAPVIYFAGRNNGVAEELTLKTNEITHKKSDYLEGTYAVHGIEEIMRPEEVVLVMDPFPAEIEKFQTTLVQGVGMTVIAVAGEQTPLPTIRIPCVPGYDAILQLLAGWNILVQVGVALGINLDKAERARKIGNEFIDPVADVGGLH
jgi:glucosamine--fructose-6-phosphate aminotransferase (isomerizing)